MTLILSGTLGVSPVTPSGTSATIDGMTVGRGAGEVATNTAVGASALAANTNGAFNNAFGNFALQANTTGGYNSAFGHNALGQSTTASYNTAFGWAAAYTNTTGTGLTVVGQSALYSNTTGSNNVAFGNSALLNNTTASNNTAVGYQAGYSTTVNNGNTYIGYQSGYSANNTTTDAYNTFVGYKAGYAVTTGTNNTFIGGGGTYQAGAAVTTGSKNTILGSFNGFQGGLDIRTASNYIVLSDGDGNARGFCNGSGQWAFGGSGTAANTQATVYANSGTGMFVQIYAIAPTLVQFANSQGNGGAITMASGGATSYGTSSDYRLKENIQPMTGALLRVSKLKPVTYNWKIDGSEGESFIAHELSEVCPQAVHGEKDKVDENGNPIYQNIDSSHLVALLTAAIQELKAEFDAYKEAHP